MIVLCVAGESFDEQHDASGETKDTKFYITFSLRKIKNAPGGPRNVFHLVVDGGTPGAKKKKKRGLSDAEFRELEKGIQEVYPWISVTLCQAHSCDLLLEGIFKLPEFADVLAKGKRIKNFIKLYQALLAEFRRLSPYTLTDFDTTRFLYAALHCENIEECHNAIVSLFHGAVFQAWKVRQVKRGAKGQAALQESAAVLAIVTDLNYWSFNKAARQCTHPICQMVRLCDGRKPNMGDIAESWFQMGQRIKELPQHTAISPARAKAIEELWEDRWSYAHHHLHSAGYALNPNFIKVHMFDIPYVMEGLQETMRVIFKAHPLGETAYENALREFNVFKACQGVYGRASTQSMIGKLPNYQWWQQYGAGTPYLQWAAIRILAMVASSSASERHYSKLGWMKGKLRNRLANDKVQKMMFVHYNLLMEDRVLDPKYMEEPVHTAIGESMVDVEISVSAYLC